MANKLSLQVILDTVDRATRPLKKITQGSGKTAEALKASRDQLRSLERAQKDLRGFRELRRQSDDTSRALEAHQREVRDLTRRIQEAGGATRDMNRQRDTAIRKANALKEKYREQTQQAQRLKTQIRDVHGITGELTGSEDSLARKIRRANEELREQQRELTEVARKQRLAADASRQFHRGMGRASRMSGAGAAGLATGGAALYGGARLLAPGISYGAQMSAVQAVGRFEKDDPRFQALKAQSRELGASTAFSATEVGAGQEFLLRAGMSSKAITTSMRDVLDLAIANNTELGRTADIASNIAGTFKVDLEQDGAMTRVADVLSATASRANVDLEMLGNTVKYLGGAEDLNLSLEQATTMAGVLGNIGIQGEMAGTAMRAMTSRLTKPTSAAAAVMQDLGVQVADARGNMRDIPAILHDINAATAGLGNVERKAALQEIFGVEAGSGMAELVSSMGSGQLTELLEQIQNARGENARMAATRADNIDGDLKSLRSAWEDIGITITETNEGPLRDLVQNATEVIRSIGAWMNDNPELTGQIAIAAAGIAGLVATFGALTLAMGSLLGPLVLTRFGLQMIGIKGEGTGKAFGKIGKAAKWLGKMLGGALFDTLKSLWGLGKKALPYLTRALGIVGRAILFISRALLMNPIGLLITAIAGGAYLIWKNWDKLGPSFADLWETIKANGLAFWEWFKSIPGRVASFVASTFMNWTLPGLLITHWDEIKAKASELWQWFQKAPGNAIDTITQMIEDWNLKEVFKEKWDAAIDYLKSLPGHMRDTGVDLAQGLGEGITAGASNAWDAIRNVATETEHIPRYELDTHSPSRVFKSIGGDLMSGLALGIRDGEKTPLHQVSAFSQRIRQAGAGLALGAATAPTIASAEIPIDHRPPLSVQGSGGVVVEGGIHISVQPTPGMDEQALARYVAAEVQRALERAAREQSARRRSAFHDTE